MIQIIGLIVAVYACTRLIQVPFEHVREPNRFPATLTFGIIGVGIIALLTVLLLSSGADAPTPNPGLIMPNR